MTSNTQKEAMVEVRNFDTSRAKNSFKGNFDLIIRTWGIIFHGCSLFEKEGQQWIKLPQRSVKNDMGMWDHTPIVSLINPELLKRLQTLAIEAISKLPAQEIKTSSEPLIYPGSFVQPGQTGIPSPKQSYEEQGLPF